MARKKFKHCCIFWLACGGITTVLGLVAIPLIRILLYHIIKEQVTLTPDSYVFKPWANPPIPIWFEFYFFDVVNPLEVVNKREKISVRERGPYTYRFTPYKTNITFHDNGTVSYRQPATYLFDETRSAGPEDDTFMTPNIVLMTILSTIKFEYEFIKKSFYDFIELIGQDKLFVKRSVRDLLWGNEDPILKNVGEILKIVGIPFDDTFGFFYKINNSDDGQWLIESGKNDIHKNFDIINWNGKKKLSFWSSDECNTMKGTDGNLFHPFIKEDDKLHYYFDELCRSMDGVYEKRYSLKGVDVMRFVPPENEFDTADTNPVNAGYCTPENVCLPKGLYNISTCKKGAPFSVSFPHFLYADEKLVENVNGLKPNKQKHLPFVDIIPDIGVVARTEQKYQLNILLQSSPLYKELKNLSDDIYFPVLWFNESTILTDSYAKTLLNSYQTPVMVARATPYVLIGFGVTVLLICFLIIYKKRTKEQKMNRERPPNERSPLITNS